MDCHTGRTLAVAHTVVAHAAVARIAVDHTAVDHIAVDHMAVDHMAAVAADEVVVVSSNHSNHHTAGTVPARAEEVLGNCPRRIAADTIVRRNLPVEVHHSSPGTAVPVGVD